MNVRTRIGIAFAATVAACVTPRTGEQPRHVTGHLLEPYGVHEECAKLVPGDRIEYAFTTDAKVNFNIHYHERAAVVEPIERQQITEDAGVFVPILAQNYCLMWEAGAAAAKLDYRMRIHRSGR